MVIYMQHSSTFQSASKWWVLASPLDLAQMKSLPIGVVPRPLLTTVKGNTHTHTVFSVFPSINKKRGKSTGQNCVWVFVSKIEKLKGAVITINISQKRRGDNVSTFFLFLDLLGRHWWWWWWWQHCWDKCRRQMQMPKNWKTMKNAFVIVFVTLPPPPPPPPPVLLVLRKRQKKADRNRSWWLTLTANCWKLSLQLVIVSVDTQKSMALLFHFILSWLPFPLTLSPGSSWSSVVSINAEVDTEVFLS